MSALLACMESSKTVRARDSTGCWCLALEALEMFTRFPVSLPAARATTARDNEIQSEKARW
ncbi:hypothetical protein GGTG_05009 [Gaeumannomyces tritici R3-111a-1]|uniref:Uncharacterized protein n=1 Tax=Gaeumannomyces tritici (strain R3-111a-1) TaxID=644352 RepID=J3NUQ3_GAET3|nr:hypothetical protein GGTG_05009 [Gaeumannomyces tritici R3-111a-1]EJT79927.1 hypothetical protein GGTG_05009 [Gaeumannomyces tritici R3-111a-1]